MIARTRIMPHGVTSSRAGCCTGAQSSSPRLPWTPWPVSPCSVCAPVAPCSPVGAGTATVLVAGSRSHALNPSAAMMAAEGIEYFTVRSLGTGVACGIAEPGASDSEGTRPVLTGSVRHRTNVHSALARTCERRDREIAPFGFVDW